MYKVFVNDRPIIFTSSSIKNDEFSVMNYKDIILEDVIKEVKTGKSNGTYLLTPNLDKVWKKFCVDYRLREAGGGLVINPNKEILFIYRANKWDLPKGRAEKNEEIEKTAIREVKEEVGIQNIVIEKFLTNTYHLYPSRGKDRLKKTYWYLMRTDVDATLQPLLEEGITEAAFFDEKKIKRIILKNTYKNIIAVYNLYRSTFA